MRLMWLIAGVILIVLVVRFVVLPMLADPSVTAIRTLLA